MCKCRCNVQKHITLLTRLCFGQKSQPKLPDLWEFTAALLKIHKRKQNNNSTFELNRQASTKITRTIGLVFSGPQKAQTKILHTDHNIQYPPPPNQIQRPVNTNNVFSKCPRRHESARGDEREISLQSLPQSQMKSSKGRVCIVEDAVFISRSIRKQRSGRERCWTPGSELQ